MGLSAKQKAFINEYLRDFNATRAAQRAGYGGDDDSLAVIGSRLLRNVKVDEAVRIRLQEKAMGPDEVLMRLGEQARADYSRYITPDGTVNVAAMVRDGKAHLIKGIKDTQFARNIEFHDAQAALVQIGKHHKLFTDGPTGTEKDPIHIKHIKEVRPSDDASE